MVEWRIMVRQREFQSRRERGVVGQLTLPMMHEVPLVLTNQRDLHDYVQMLVERQMVTGPIFRKGFPRR
jgi:hypothetical protein